MDKTAMPFRYRINGKSLLEIPITVLPTKFPLNKSAALASAISGMSVIISCLGQSGDWHIITNHYG